MNKRLLLILIAFCISFIVMVGLSLFSIGRLTTFTEYSNELLHSNKVIRTLYKTEVYLKDVDRWERGYMLTHDTVYLRLVNNAIDSIYPSIDNLEQLVKKDKTEYKNILELRDLIILRIRYGRYNIALVDTTKNNQASSYYYEGRKNMIAANRLIRKLHNTQNQILSERFSKHQFYQQLTTDTLKSLLIVFCIVTLILFVLLIKLMKISTLYQYQLQSRVQELKKSHTELQDIAYAISHNLQEPLRKIQVLSNMLVYNNEETKNETIETLQRINKSAHKMHVLITDLADLTNLTKTDENKSPTNINRIVQHTLIDLGDRVKEKNALIKVSQLPTIDGYELQLKMLFKALIDNALKFSKTNELPCITISYKKVNEPIVSHNNNADPNTNYHRISISDTGIGFENKYIDNIFKIFGRLHTDQSGYDGKGVGLAKCNRIMTNHNGYIAAEGVVNDGARFHLYFPI